MTAVPGPQGRRRELRISDLDRCRHGRHVRDLCFECRDNTNGDLDNVGNPNLDLVIGYGLDGPFSVRDLLRTIDRDGTAS